MLILPRRGDLLPERVPGVAGVWYDDRNVFADAGASVPAAIGADVAAWLPVAGALPAWSQSDSGKRPTRQAAGIVFDGTSDVLSYAGNSVMAATSRTVIALLSAAAPGGTVGLLSAAAANWYVGAGGGGVMRSNWANAAATTQALASAPTGLFDSTPRVYAWRHATSGSDVTIQHWRDGVAGASISRTDGMQASAPTTWFLGAYNGSSLYGAWTIRALALFATALDDAAIAAITASWRRRYR